MKQPIFVFLGTAIALSTISLARGQTLVVESSLKSCNFQAYIRDPDPAGTHVRAAPNAKAPILARLLKEKDPDGYEFSASFDVIGWKEGWALITNAATTRGDVMFTGPGWISARLLDFSFGLTKVRAAPRRDAPLVTGWIGSEDSEDRMTIHKIHDCENQYVEVTFSLKSRPKMRLRGWITNICGNQATTCTGALDEGLDEAEEE